MVAFKKPDKPDMSRYISCVQIMYQRYAALEKIIKGGDARCIMFTIKDKKPPENLGLAIGFNDGDDTQFIPLARLVFFTKELEDFVPAPNEEFDEWLKLNSGKEERDPATLVNNKKEDEFVTDLLERIGGEPSICSHPDVLPVDVPKLPAHVEKRFLELLETMNPDDAIAKIFSEWIGEDGKFEDKKEEEDDE